MSNPIDYWYQKYMALKKDKEDMYLRGVRDMREQMMKGGKEYKVGWHGEPIQITLDKYVQQSMGIYPGENLKIIFVKENEK